MHTGGSHPLRKSTGNTASTLSTPYRTPTPSPRSTNTPSVIDSQGGNTSPRSNPGPPSDSPPLPRVSNRESSIQPSTCSVALPGSLAAQVASDPNKTLQSIWSKYRAFAPPRDPNQVKQRINARSDKTEVKALLKNAPRFAGLSRKAASDYILAHQPTLSESETIDMVELVFQVQPGWLKMHRNIGEIESILGQLPANLGTIEPSDLEVALQNIRKKLTSDEVACVLKLIMDADCGGFSTEVKVFDDKKILRELMSLLWQSDVADMPGTPRGITSIEGRASNWLNLLKQAGHAELQPSAPATGFKRKKLSRSNRTTIHRGRPPLSTSLQSPSSTIATGTSAPSAAIPRTSTGTTTTTTTTTTTKASSTAAQLQDDTPSRFTTGSSTLETPRNNSRRASAPKIRSISPRGSAKSAKKSLPSKSRRARASSMIAALPIQSSVSAKKSDNAAQSQRDTKVDTPPSRNRSGSMPVARAPDDLASDRKSAASETVSKRKQLQPRRRSMTLIPKLNLSATSPVMEKQSSRTSEKTDRSRSDHHSGAEKQQLRPALSKSATGPRASKVDAPISPKPPRLLKADLLVLQSEMWRELCNTPHEKFRGQFRDLLKAVFENLPADVNLNTDPQTFQIVQKAVAKARFTNDQQQIFSRVADSFNKNPALLGIHDNAPEMGVLIKLIAVILQPDPQKIRASEKS